MKLLRWGAGKVMLFASQVSIILPGASLFRVTELGDSRVLENGDTRITEE